MQGQKGIRVAFFVAFVMLLAMSCSLFTGKGKVSHKDGAQLTAAKAMITAITSAMALQLESDGVPAGQALAITKAAEKHALAQSGSLVVGLRLTGYERFKSWLGLRVANTSLLMSIMPLVMQGAVAAVDEAGVSQAADKASVSGKIMKSGMVSIKSYVSEVSTANLMTLNSTMTKAGIAALADTGLAVEDLGAAVRDMAQSSIGAMALMEIPVAAMAQIAGAITEGAFQGLSSIASDTSSLVGDVVSGAVSGLGDVGMSDSLATSAMKEITTNAVTSLGDAGISDLDAINSAIASISASAIASIDEAGLSGDAVLGAVGAIAGGIGVGCAEMADTGDITGSELGGVLSAATSSISSEAGSLGISENDLAQTITQDMLEGVSQGGGDQAAIQESVTQAVIDVMGDDVAESVNTAAEAAQEFDTALNNETGMTLCSVYDDQDDNALTTFVFDPVIAGDSLFCRFDLGGDCPVARTLNETRHVMWDGNFSGSICKAYVVVDAGVEMPTPTPVATTTAEATPDPTATVVVASTVPAWLRVDHWSASMSLKWDPVVVPGKTVTYRLYYGVTPGVNGGSALREFSSPTGWLSPMSDLGNASTVCMRIAALLDGMLGELSDEVCAASGSLTLSPSLNIPSQTLTISWTPPANLVSQTVFWSTDSSLPLALWNKAEGVTAPYIHAGMVKGVYYYFVLMTRFLQGGVEYQRFSSVLSQQVPGPWGSVSINAGSGYTGSTNVTLSLSWSNATEMMIANAVDFSSGVWEPVAHPKAWVLGAGNQLVRVFVKFRDADGVESAVQSDSIVHDSLAPTATSPTLLPGSSGYLLTPRAKATVSPDVNYVELFADGGCSSAIASGTYTDVASTGVAFTVLPGTVTSIYVKVFDAAGNVSGCVAVGTYTHDGTVVWLDASDTNGDGAPNVGSIAAANIWDWKNRATPTATNTVSFGGFAAGQQWEGDGTEASPYRLDFPGGNSTARYVGVSGTSLARSYMAWFNVHTTDIYSRYIFSKFDGTNALSGCSVASGLLSCVYKNGPSTTLGGVGLNEWHHVAITADNTTTRFYLDGILRDSQAGTAENVLWPIYLGGKNDWSGCGGNACFDGSIAEFHANATLAPNDADVRWAYEAGRTRFYTAPVGPQIDMVLPAVGGLTAGTPVTIYGWNLGSGPTPKVDGVDFTTATVVKPGMLTGVLPAGTEGVKSMTIDGTVIPNVYRYTVHPFADLIEVDAANTNSGGAGAAPTLVNRNWFSLSAIGIPQGGFLSGHTLPGSASGGTSGWLGDGSPADPMRLQFNGSTDYVNFGPVAPASSYVLWFNWSGTGGSSGKTLLSKYTTNTRISISSGYLSLTYNNGPGWSSSPITVTSGVWNQVAMVFDGSNTIYYLNGVQVGTTGGAPEGAADQLALAHLGGANSISAWAFGGGVATLRVFSPSLSTGNIKELYNLEKNRFPLVPSLNTFTAVQSGTTGEIHLNWENPGPGVYWHYSRIEVRRQPAGPPADCSSGTPIQNYLTFSPYMAATTDAGLGSNQPFGYRICVYDGGDDLIGSRTAIANSGI